MVVAHAPISYLVNEKLQKKHISKLKFHEQMLVAILSILFGILPDFDFFYALYKDIPTFEHHSFITHTPLFYIGIWLILRVLVNIFYEVLNKRSKAVLDKRLINIIINTFLISTLVHLFADLLVNSIMLVYPFSSFKFFILQNIFEPNLFAGYLMSVLFAIEVVIWSVFMYAIYVKFLKKNNIATFVLKSLVVLATIYLPFSIFMSLNTYNRSYMYDSQDKRNYDIDRDTLGDSMDMDIGNTGKNNIQKVNEVELLDSVLDIVNSNMWTENGKNKLLGNMKGRYGGFSSYRIVSQAYFNVHLPIEPVLRDYSIKRDGFDSYRKNYDYEQLLFDYLQDEEELISLNLDTPVNIASSKIFFILNEEEEILNMGITVEGNYMATVLEDDMKMRIHSFESVKEGVSTIYIQK